MIVNAAGHVADVLVKEKIAGEEEREIYRYGIELLISTIINLCLVLVLGGVFDSVYSGIIYFFILATLRTQAGGYHASSYLNCGVLYCVVFLSVLFLSGCLDRHNIEPTSYIFILFVNLLYMWRNAPVLHKKVLEEREKKAAKRKVLYRGGGWIFLAIFFSLFHGNGMYIIGNSMLCISAFMIIGKYAEKRGEKDEK